MGPKLAFMVCAALSAMVVSPAGAQAPVPGVSISIERLANLTDAGVAVMQLHVTCGPFDGVEDFQEAHAGAGQTKTGAGAEGGIDGTVVCDGVERVYTAHVSPHTDAGFKPGPATGFASMFLCMLVGDEQTCFQGGTSSRIILRGGPG